MTAPTPTFRAILASSATIAGLVGVLGFSPAGGQLTATSDAVEESTASEGSTSASPEDSTTDSASSPDSSSSESPEAGSQDASSSSGRSSTGSSTDSSDASTTTTDGTYTGTAYQSPYGAMQVEVTISGGAITDIQWVQLPADHHSLMINEQAAPILVSEALSAQSAQVDSVTGASFTSEGFRESLQSALDQAGFDA